MDYNGFWPGGYDPVDLPQSMTPYLPQLNRAAHYMDRGVAGARYARGTSVGQFIESGLAVSLGRQVPEEIDTGFMSQSRYTTFGDEGITAAFKRGFYAPKAKPMGMAGHVGGGLAAVGLRRGLNVGFAGYSTYAGYKEEGLWGAGKGFVYNAVSEAAIERISIAAHRAGGAGNLARAMSGGAVRGISSIALPAVMGTMGVAFSVAQVNKFGAYKHGKLPLETAGSLAAFQTRSAFSMRQRSMQSIQRSHLNARTVFGNEAQYMHFNSYRNI